MKRQTIIIAIILIFSTIGNAQENKENGITLKNQAEESLKQQEYIKARYLFKRAYDKFVVQSNYAEAIPCGIKANSLYIRESMYKEAFDFLKEMEAALLSGEGKQGKKMYDLRFLLGKERMDIYTRSKSTERAKEQLGRLEEIANLSKNDSISEELLYIKANYYFTFGPVDSGISSYRKLINQYKQQGKTERIDDCYKNMIALAEKINNASLALKTYKAYAAWTDSVKAVTATNELAEIKQKYSTTQTELQEREKDLSMQWYKFIAVCTLSVILIAALIFYTVVLLRFVHLTRKQKKNIEIANEHSRLKSTFIQNISMQMEPTLNTLAQSALSLSEQGEKSELMLDQINALRDFSHHIQELSLLENALSEPYELSEVNTSAFCEQVADKVRPYKRPEVELVVNAAKSLIKTNPEQLEHILIHLMKNAAYFTETGRITLELKRRAAHTFQFIVTDTGCRIPAELQENLFKPFTEIKDLTKGDGLGLPICSLIATRMNGTLALDTSYTKGSRFILELHS